MPASSDEAIVRIASSLGIAAHGHIIAGTVTQV
jgi:hypothetical protein